VVKGGKPNTPKMVIEIPFLPPGEMSPNWRGHWSAQSPAAAEFRRAAWLCCVNRRNLARQWVPFSRPVMNLTFIFGIERRRDEDNMRTRFKPGLDGIVDAGLLVDDDPRRLITGTLEMVVDKDRAPLTIIELEETDG
jgi:hypothetical protein